MAIFDRFIRKPEEEKENRATLSAWTRQTLSELNENTDRGRDASGEVKAFYKQIEQKLRGEASRAGRSEESRNAGVLLSLSEDHLRAYLCLLPPRNGGADISHDELDAQLRYAGIVSGIRKDRLHRAVEEREYAKILLAAQGSVPTEGSDGSLAELFPHDEAPNLTLPDDATVDFRKTDFVHPVRAGDVLCRIVPPVPGHDGAEVTGRAIPCQSVSEVKIPMGEGTALSSDGRELTASCDGILYSKDGLFCVQPMHVVTGSLSAAAESVDVSGGLLITGDVKGGASARASGDIIVAGSVLDGSVTSAGGCIRVQKGVRGVEGVTVLRAAGQIQVASAENAELRAGASVIAEVLSDCRVVSGRTVSVLGGMGLLAGGYVQAEKRILCVQLGNIGGSLTRLAVGCTPEAVQDWEINKKELERVQQVMDKLWDNIASLKKLGKLNDEQKSLLTKLQEQRNLYDEKRHDLRALREGLRQQLHGSASGRVQCKELHPIVEVQIGEHHAEIRTQEHNLNIHATDTDIALHGNL